MSVHLKYRVDKIKKYLTFFAPLRWRESVAAADLEIVDPAEPRFDAPSDGGDWRPFALNGEWGGKQQWAWFKGKVTVPAHWSGRFIAVRVSHEAKSLDCGADDLYPAGPEGQVFVEGRRAGAIDQIHDFVLHEFEPGRSYDVFAVFFAGRNACRHRLTGFDLAYRDEPTERIYHDLRVLLDIVDRLPETAIVREKLLRAMDAAIHAINFAEHTRVTFPAEWKRSPGREEFYASLPGAQAILDAALAELSEQEVPSVVCVGHAHIDLAWLWEIEHTHHKCARTFATQCKLLERYPDWIFQQSSPQAYEWIERDAPDLFARIQNWVAQGRWEADGATWVEMDTNVPAGESLVRQLLYGKRYFKEKFGVDSRMLWLPDVFGYSAALPQLLKLAGVDGFVTSKISWSQFNRFPHDTFRWRGLDGTETATHFITTPAGTWLTYNAMLTAADVEGSWQEYRQKDRLLEPLISFGYGDGGGGPTTMMLETGRRLRDWGGKVALPRVKYEKAGSLMARIAARADELPVWDGELYLEFHRGTYTTQAWLKRAHRQNEIALHNLEWLATLAGPLGYKLDKQRLDAVWKDLLFTEFHDVLPGSSVGGVYNQVRVIMQRLADEARQMTAAAMETIAAHVDTAGSQKPLVLFNTLSWDRRDPVRLPDGSWRNDITVPAGGWTAIDTAQPAPPPAHAATATPDGRGLENRFWSVRFDEAGRIAQLTDKSTGRAIFTAERPGNLWQTFDDRPLNFEAWDIEHFYEQHPLPGPQLQSLKVVEQGPVRAAMELRWAMPLIGRGPQSTITQRIALYSDCPRIDFETEAEWYDHHVLLKAAFPTDIRATDAACEIQFGHLKRPTHRNTSWDFAKFEVCAHRWVDLSEFGYGLALLNDCKYGHDIRDGVVRLTCIKSPQAPNGTADRGRHIFTYALLPHAGSLQEAGVIRTAAELNVPVLTQPVEAARGQLPGTASFVSCDNPAVIVDTLKPAEDGRGVILRVYESFGSHASATLRLASAPGRVRVVDLLEEPRDDDVKLRHSGDTLGLALRPFQMVSLRLEA